MKNAPRVAAAEVCDEYQCRVGYTMVRADQVEFVSVEQVRKVGYHKLDAEKMPSDLTIPAPFVLVHDTTGELLSRCDLYVVKWHKGDRYDVNPTPQSDDALADARQYFGRRAKLSFGSVDVPEGPWRQFARVQFIRYRRAGNHAGLYEHEYDPPITLYACKSPPAFRVALPQGCVVDERGFVWP